MEFGRRLLAVLLAAIATLRFVDAADTRRVIEISTLLPEQADRRESVSLRGIVTFVEPGMIFFQDETAGTYFRPRDLVTVQPGDEIEVTGHTDTGIYLPGLSASRFQVLGHGPLPPAIDVTYEDLLSGRFHYQRVALQGAVRSITALSERRSLARLAVGARAMDVWVEESVGTPPLMVDSLVRVRGLAVGTINNRRQLVQPYVRVHGWADFEVLRPATPETAVPRVAASELLTYGLARQGGGRVRVLGTVTASFSGGMFYMRSEGVPLGVRFARPGPLQIGDTVEVLGFPQMNRFTASLVDAQLIERRSGPVPDPVKLQLDDLFRGAHDNDLVEVTARVTDVFRTDRDRLLILQENERRVRVAALDSTIEVTIGSVARVTGITRVNLSEGTGYSTQPEVITIYVRSPADFLIVARPPWWTVRRLSLISGALGGIMLFAMLWIWMLRREVRRQAAAVVRGIEADVALQERHRLARDFHDTLEQELVGLGLRLDAIRTGDLDEKRRALVATSRSLVSRIQAETRNLVGDLRSPRGHLIDLHVAFDDLLELNTADAACEIALEIQSEITPLPVGVVHNLRMIARESVTNALKHAGATLIVVRLAVIGDATLRLSITDNGRGFDASRDTHGKTGHYGCVGIRERCSKIGAKVDWRTSPGKECSVEVTIPLPPNKHAKRSSVMAAEWQEPVDVAQADSKRAIV